MRMLSFALILLSLLALSACASGNNSVEVQPKGEMAVGGSVSGTR